MGQFERWMKGSALAPVRIAGEILFGTDGEEWERQKKCRQGEWQ